MGNINFNTYYDGLDRLQSEGVPSSMIEDYTESFYRNQFKDIDPRIINNFKKNYKDSSYVMQYPYSSWVDETGNRMVSGFDNTIVAPNIEPLGHNKIGSRTNKKVPNRKTIIQQAGNIGTPTQEELYSMFDFSPEARTYRAKQKIAEDASKGKGAKNSYGLRTGEGKVWTPTHDSNINTYKQNMYNPYKNVEIPFMNQPHRVDGKKLRTGRILSTLGKGAGAAALIYGADTLSDYLMNDDYQSTGEIVYDPNTGDYVEAMWNPEVEAWVPRR